MHERCMRSCAARHQIVTMGFSRERHNLYDIADFLGEEFNHEKLHQALRLGAQQPDGSWGLLHNLSFVSTYGPAELDMWTWNWEEGKELPPGGYEPFMNETKFRMAADFAALGLCQPGDARPTSILVTVESLFPAWAGYSGIWRRLAQATLQQLRSVCPKAQIVHKTSVAARMAAGSLTWQRLWQASRDAEDVAFELKMPTIDAFSMTQMWLPDGAVLADGLHFNVLEKKYETALGNFVTKTISQLFLRQTCPEECGKEA
jgi:hypothetical protein